MILFTSQALALVTYCLFKAKLLPERIYLKLLSLVTSVIAIRYPNLIWVHYQDYVHLSPRARKSIKYDFCELIIDTNPEQPNFLATRKAINSAHSVILPAESMFQPYLDNKPVLLAPYGGDKAQYMIVTAPKNNSPWFSSHLRHDLVFLVRSNSYRKGIDIFLNSIACLLHDYPQVANYSIKFIICGSLTEAYARDLYCDFSSRFLSQLGNISICSRQFSQLSYTSLLTTANFFIMPSRLEGSSPAALEALWHGIPCILSRSCGVTNFVNQRHGFLLESNRPEELAKILYSVIASKALIEQCRKNIAIDRDLFTWNNYFHAYQSLMTSNLFSK